jgi:hypothetical protein
MSNVLDVLKEHMRVHGYDGLVSDDRECACSLNFGGLAPCEASALSCDLGYTVDRDKSPEHPMFLDGNDGDFIVTTEAWTSTVKP